MIGELHWMASFWKPLHSFENYANSADRQCGSWACISCGGPGPGLTTDLLCLRFDRITALEVDPALADSLKRRMSDTNVAVIQGDASAMPFEDATFSGAGAFTMLHHVPSSALQDRLLHDVYRVLKPGGMFVETDSVWSPVLWLIHISDTLVPVDTRTFKDRLEGASFTDVQIELGRKRFRFRARRA